MRRPLIALDFDGTLVTHVYDKFDPSVVGEDIGAAPWLRRVSGVVDYILLTMRDGAHLGAAISWCHERNIPISWANENPLQLRWTSSRKVYSNLYIDDAALGAPLTTSPGNDKPHVDWTIAGPFLHNWVRNYYA